MAIGGPASDRLAAIAAEHGVWLVVGVDEREPHGATIYNTVLYFSPDGGAGRAAQEARAHGGRTDCMGHGRRIHAPRGGRLLGPDRRPDLLGELHAAGPVPPVRPGHRRVARPYSGVGRRLDRDHAPPRPGEPDVRRRRQPGPARRPGTSRLSRRATACSLPATSSRTARGWRRATPSSWRRTARCWPARSASVRKRWSQTSTCGASRQLAATWIRSVTTTGPTSSG